VPDSYLPAPQVTLTHPDWSKNATIYQINTRQFTPEGTLAAARAQLPWLVDLGVSILWLMPVQQIGELHRKGRLGSPYAIKDYFQVNDEFGAAEDLKSFVRAAHDLGLHVILDWVANHTAWDSNLVAEHRSGMSATTRATSARRRGGTGTTSSTSTSASRGSGDT
jgi:1,4-alpha-glucan branching enzyme